MQSQSGDSKKSGSESKQEQDQISQTTEMHPSGLTMERWRFPFKTAAELNQIRQWLAVNDLNSGAIPF